MDDTDFSKLIPDCLVAPFRKCHVNVVLGNYGTASVLCGAILERALKDLLNSTGSFFQLIEEAEDDGLLRGDNIRHAQAIYKVRSNAVHGKRDFRSISSVKAWECLDMTRKLVSDLYRGRLEGE